MMPAWNFERYKAEVEEVLERRESLALRDKEESEQHSDIYGRLGEGIGVKTYLHGPIGFAKHLKQLFRLG